MIEYKDVSLEREQQLLLRDVNLHIGRGEFVYLIGKVGSGKSSLLKSLYAEIPILEGDAHVFEFDLKSLRRKQIPMLRRRLGIIFQDFQLLVDRTVQQNLDFVLKATDWKSEAERNRRIEEVLQLVGMENKGYRMPNTLSGGEQQRIVIARALLNNPAVILADEPTGNLDPETGYNIVQLLYDICHQHNTTVLMSTHNLQLLEQFPGRVLKVEDGRVCEVTASTDSGETMAEEVPTSESIEEVVASVEEEVATAPSEESVTEEPVMEEENSVTEEVAPAPVDENPEVVEEEPIDQEPIAEQETFVEPEITAEVDPQSVPTEATPEETQNDSSQDSDDSNSAESHCSPSDTEPEERSYNGQFGQIPSDSAAL